jgi:phospholipid/cholesterol/gamma-HCH transport system permease protein
MPMLTAIANLVANFGSWMIATRIFSVDNSEYFAQVSNFVALKDLAQGLIKSFFFGFVVATVGTYFGHNVKNGAAGVGQATNKAVVWGMMAVIIADYILTSILILIL